MKVRIKSRESIIALDTTVSVARDGSFRNTAPAMTFTPEMQYLFGKVIEVKKTGIWYTVPRQNNPNDTWYLIADWFVVIPKPKLSFSKGDKYA